MIRRWRNFGASGAKLIWGGEAMAVRPEGRANPNQLIINEANKKGLARLREACWLPPRGLWPTDDLSLDSIHTPGRFCRPNDKQRTEPTAWRTVIRFRKEVWRYAATHRS